MKGKEGDDKTRRRIMQETTRMDHENARERYKVHLST
jgi:hypothetical protein